MQSRSQFAAVGYQLRAARCRTYLAPDYSKFVAAVAHEAMIVAPFQETVMSEYVTMSTASRWAQS
jgi:hypothetical protein